MSVKFDIEQDLNSRPALSRKLMVDAMRRRQFDRQSAARRDKRHPGANVPVFAPDQIPDFDVVVIVERQRGNRWEARLNWYLLGHSGQFPVIPADELAEREPRRPTMAPHGFQQERLAVIEAAHQASALTDQFMRWATNEGD